MAQDLTGLLGGALLPPAQPVALTSAQDYTRIMQEANKGFSQAVGGMFGVDTRTTPEFVQEEVAKLNPESVEDQAKIVELVGKINPAGAVALKSAFAQKAAEKNILTSQTNALLKIARAQGNNAMVTWLEAQGDINTAASVLLKQPKLATPEAYTTMYDESGGPIRTAVIGGKLHKATETGWELIRDNEKLSAEKPKEKPEKTTPKVSLTAKEREKTYDAIISTNPDIAKVFTEGGWWDSVDKDAKTLLLNKAEELYAANPKLGREGALLQAAEVAPTTTGQPVPRADSFVGKTIK